MIFFLIYANSFKGYDDHEESQSNRNDEIYLDESSMQSTSSFVRNCFRSMEIANSSSEDDDECDAFTEATKKAFLKQIILKRSVSMLIQIFIFPWLRKLAFVVHFVPATQVSVERLFSALRLILGDLRYSLSEENLEAIMMVKLNYIRI